MRRFGELAARRRALQFRRDRHRSQQRAVRIDLERGAADDAPVLTRDQQRRQMIDEASTGNPLVRRRRNTSSASLARPFRS